MAGIPQQSQVSAPSFGELLRQYRRAAGLTQDKLAERAGMAARSIRALEHGERRAPYRVTVEMLAHGLDLTGDERAAFEHAATVSRAQGRGQNVRSVSGNGPRPVVPRYSLPTDVPLVGRDAELQWILRQVERVSEGCRVILLSSEAGGGKTRLLAEVVERTRIAGVMTLAGGCYEQEGRLPYGPIHDALLDYIRTQSDTVLGEQLDGIEEDIARLFPDLRGRFAPAMQATGDGESERLRLFRAIAVFMERIALTHPVLVVLDDLQSADDATLALLHYLIRHLRDYPVLIIGGYREDEIVKGASLDQFSHEVDQAPSGSSIHLAPLTISDLHSLLIERLQGHCAESLVRALHSRSEGNPFFALQMLRLLEQEAVLIEGPEGWQMVPGGSVDLPMEVRDTIARRFHALSAEVRETLTAAAMLGREFSYRALAAIWPVDEIVLDRTLDTAVTAYLLIETPDGYVFRHPLLREVICNEIPVQRRPRWHARIGVALESLYSQAASAHASELALHFEGAGEEFRGQAIHYLTLAGDISARAFSWSEAEKYYRRAAALATADIDAVDAEEKLGRVLKTMGRYDESLDALGRAADSYERLERYDDVVRTLAHTGATYLSSGRAVEGTAHLEHELLRLEDLASSISLAMAYGSLAGLYHVQSRHAEQRAIAERVVALAGHSGDQRTIADASAVLGLALINEGNLEEARSLLSDAMKATETEVDLSTGILILNNLAWIADVRGEAENSAAYLKQAASLADRHGNTAQIIFILHAQGRHAFRHGNWTAADALFAQALALDMQVGPSWASPYVRLWLGRLALARGDWDAGTAELRECVEIAERNGDNQVIFQAQCFLAGHDLALDHPIQARDTLISLLAQTDSGIEDIGLARALPILAVAHLRNGERAAAESTARRAVTIARKQGFREALMTALEVQGKVLAAQGHEPEAEGSLEEALHLARVMQFPLDEANILRARAEVATRLGRQDRAREETCEALNIYRRLGARYEVQRTERNIEALASGEY